MTISASYMFYSNLNLIEVNYTPYINRNFAGHIMLMGYYTVHALDTPQTPQTRSENERTARKSRATRRALLCHSSCQSGNHSSHRENSWPLVFGRTLVSTHRRLYAAVPENRSVFDLTVAAFDEVPRPRMSNSSYCGNPTVLDSSMCRACLTTIGR